MKKYPKWKVNVASQNFFTVEIEAESEHQAVSKAVNEVQTNPSYHITGNATLITGVYINDREARDFQLYVPESFPRQESNDLLPKSTDSV